MITTIPNQSIFKGRS